MRYPHFGLGRNRGEGYKVSSTIVDSAPLGAVGWPHSTRHWLTVALLEEMVARANDLQERANVATLSTDLAVYLNNDPSGGWLESAQSNATPEKRLFYATYGLRFAGEVIGAANVALERADPVALVERGNRLRTATTTVLDSHGDYRVTDPAQELAYLCFTERELASVRLDSYRSGTDMGNVASAAEYSDRDIVSTWGTHLRAKQHLRTTRYYRDRDRYRANHGDNVHPYASVLSDALTALTAAVNECPTFDEMRILVEKELELTQETPYGAARWSRLTLCYDNNFRFGFETGGFRHRHTVQHVVEVARALLARRAHEFALSELGVSPDDVDHDSGRALRARAVWFRAVRARFDSPFAGILAEDAAELIRVGDLGVGSWGHRSTDKPAWHGRVEATTCYLVATGLMHELGAVLGTISDVVW